MITNTFNFTPQIYKANTTNRAIQNKTNNAGVLFRGSEAMQQVDTVQQYKQDTNNLKALITNAVADYTGKVYGGLSDENKDKLAHLFLLEKEFNHIYFQKDQEKINKQRLGELMQQKRQTHGEIKAEDSAYAALDKPFLSMINIRYRSQMSNDTDKKFATAIAAGIKKAIINTVGDRIKKLSHEEKK